MPTTPHVEKHFTATETVRDVVIGMADGLTVPFALAAGLAAAVSSTAVIVTAGLAEIVAGAIAMGLGGYLAARTDAEHYAAEQTAKTGRLIISATEKWRKWLKCFVATACRGATRNGGWRHNFGPAALARLYDAV